MPFFRFERHLDSIPAVNLDRVTASNPFSSSIAALFYDLSAMTTDSTSCATLNSDTLPIPYSDEVDEPEEILSPHGVAIEELSDASHEPIGSHLLHRPCSRLNFAHV